MADEQRVMIPNYRDNTARPAFPKEIAHIREQHRIANARALGREPTKEAA